MIFWNRKNLERIALLPDGMRQRGEYILRNPRMGRRPLGKTDSGEKFWSNCWGTTVFLEGENSYQECKRISMKNPFIIRGIPSVYWEKRNRPGLVEIDVMEEFLDNNYKKVDNPRAGDVVVVVGDYRRNWLAHTGIWTGVGNYVLGQHNLGGNFGLQEFFGQGRNRSFYFARRSK